MSNPFETRSDVNPFADPSVAQASQAPAAPSPSGTSDQGSFANPFAATAAQPAEPAPAANAGSYQPPTPQSTTSNASSTSNPFGSGGSNAAASSASGSDRLKDWERELQNKEAELERRERELKQREAMIDPTQIRNWPSCYPIAHNDIKNDIPAEKQGVVRFVFFAWLLSAICFIWNFICIVALWVTDTIEGSGGAQFGIALAYAGVGLPYTWGSMYKAAYKASMTGKSRRYMQCFLGMGLNTLFAIMAGLGIPKIAVAGLINMIDTFTQNEDNVGALIVIATILWWMCALTCAWVFKMVRTQWKNEPEGDVVPPRLSITA